MDQSRSRPAVVDALPQAQATRRFDLNPIRAALAETLEESDYTSPQRRLESLQFTDTNPDRFLPNNWQRGASPETA